jgi:hypothetical protein
MNLRTIISELRAGKRPTQGVYRRSKMTRLLQVIVCVCVFVCVCMQVSYTRMPGSAMMTCLLQANLHVCVCVVCVCVPLKECTGDQRCCKCCVL